MGERSLVWVPALIFAFFHLITFLPSTTKQESYNQSYNNIHTAEVGNHFEAVCQFQLCEVLYVPPDTANGDIREIKSVAKWTCHCILFDNDNINWHINVPIPQHFVFVTLCCITSMCTLKLTNNKAFAFLNVIFFYFYFFKFFFFKFQKQHMCIKWLPTLARVLGGCRPLPYSE